MDCQQVLPLLTPLCDGELGAESRARVAEHVEQCSHCAAELTAIRELGEAARNYAVPEPPADLWHRIACELATRPPAASWNFVRWARVAAVAALVLIALYSGWLAYRVPVKAPESAMTSPSVDLGRYLDAGVPADFAGGQALLAVAMRPQEAASHVQFRFFDGAKLPDGYAAGCCMVGRCGGGKLVQTEYRRDTDCCVVLQYPRGLPVGAGNRPVEVVQINGKPVQVVKGQMCWAASWEVRETGVTILGRGDRAEVLRLVAYVDRQFEGDQP